MKIVTTILITTLLGFYCFKTYPESNSRNKANTQIWISFNLLDKGRGQLSSKWAWIIIDMEQSMVTVSKVVNYVDVESEIIIELSQEELCAVWETIRDFINTQQSIEYSNEVEKYSLGIVITKGNNELAFYKCISDITKETIELRNVISVLNKYVQYEWQEQ